MQDGCLGKQATSGAGCATCYRSSVLGRQNEMALYHILKGAMHTSRLTEHFYLCKIVSRIDCMCDMLPREIKNLLTERLLGPHADATLMSPRHRDPL
jgi:hypothetical protein